MAITTKKLIAEEYVVSSSVTLMTQSLSSGSTVFGDSLDDTHQFTGSVSISGSAGLSVKGNNNLSSRIRLENTAGSSVFHITPIYNDDALAIQDESGNSIVYITDEGSTGNVGIGDTSPTEGKLVVAGTGAYNTPALHLEITDSTTFNHVVNMRNSNLTAGENMIITFGQELDTKNAAYIGYKHRSDHGDDNQLTLGFWSSNNLVNLLPNGKLGIGTETPSSFVDVTFAGDDGLAINSTDSNANLYLQANGTTKWQFINAPSQHELFITSAAGNAITIQQDGDVGIGTTNPQKQLEVIVPENNFVSFAVQHSPGSHAGIHFGYRENNNLYRHSQLRFQRTDRFANNAMGRIMLINKTATDSSNPGESDAHLTIDELGFVGIGRNVGGHYSTGPRIQALLHVSASSVVGTATASLHVEGSGSLVVSVDGTQGRLFSISDELSGSLFSANTISGLPVIEAFSDNKVTLGPFSNPVIVTATGNVSGSASSTGSFGSLRVAQAAGAQDARLYIKNTTANNYGINLFQQADFNALQIDNSGNSNRAAYIYTAKSSAATELVTILSDSTTFGQAALLVRNDDADQSTIQVNGGLGVVLNDTAVGVSGSQYSTGSFGQLFVNKNIRAQADGYGVYLRALQNTSGFAVTRFLSNGGTELFNFGLNSSNNLYYFSYGTDSVILEIFRTTGNFDFKGNTIITGNVSGSATSTGSFGHVKVGADNQYGNVEFVRNGGVSVGGIGWHSDACFYVAGHPLYGPTAGNDVKIYGFGSDIHIGDSNNGNVITVLQSNGNVGIGNTSPDTALHLKSTTDAEPYITIEQAGANVNSGGITMANFDTQDNDILGTIRFKGKNDTPAVVEYATIYSRAIDVSTGTTDAELHFRTVDNNTLATRMIIQSGRVGIGGTTTPQATLDVVGSTILNSAQTDSDFAVKNDAITAIDLDGTAQGAASNQHHGRIGIMTAKNNNNAVVNIGGNANSYFGGGVVWGTAIAHTVTAHSSNSAGLYVNNTLTGGNTQTNPVLANAFFTVPTWTEGSSNTINLAANVYISHAPTVTNHSGESHALHVAAGTSYFGGNVSGSVDSTGSFGRIQVPKGRYLEFLEGGAGTADKWQIFNSNANIFEIKSTAYGGSPITIDATGGGVNVTANLDVGAGVDVTGNSTFNGNITLTANDQIKVDGNSTNKLELYNGSSGHMKLIAGDTTYNYGMEFTQNGVRAMSILGGKVGIGNASQARTPTFRFTVAESTSDPVAFFGYSQVNAEDKHGLIVIQSGTIPQSGGDLSGEAGIIFRHSGGTGGVNFDGNAGSIKSLKMDTYSGTGQAHNRLVFSTTFNNTDGERMTILDSGNVGIGHTSPEVTLQVMGDTTISGSDSSALDLFVRNHHGTGLSRIIAQNNNVDMNAQLIADDANNVASVGSSTGGSKFIKFVGGTTNAYFDGGNFGINESSPVAKLHVSTADSGITPNAVADDLFVENNTHGGITIGTPNSVKGYLFFADPEDNAGAGINYNHATNNMAIAAGGTTRMVISGSGKVGIGTNAPTESLMIRGNSTGTNGFAYPAIAGYTLNTKLWALEQHFGYEGRLALYDTGTLKVLFRASGSSYINTGSTLKFGIGTDSPSYKLHVNGTAFAKNLTLSGWSTGDGLTLNYGNSTGTVEAVSFLANGGTNGNIKMVMASANVGDMHFNASNRTNQIVAYRDGKVGIGTNVPSQLLDVYGSIQVYSDIRMYNGTSLRFHGNGVVSMNGSATTQTFGSTGGSVNSHFNVGGVTAAMMISGSTGNVGIGNLRPQHTLDVYGTDDVTMRIHRPSSGLGSNDSCGIGFSHRSDTSISTSDVRAGIFSIYNGEMFLATEAGGNLNSNPIDHSRLYIDGAGLVGIGTTNPIRVLDVVVSSGDGTIRMATSGQAADVINLRNADGRIGFGGDVITVNGSNVGIGTVSPDTLFHIFGDDETLFIEQDPLQAGGGRLYISAAGGADNANSAKVQLHNAGMMWGRTDGSGIRIGSTDTTQVWFRTGNGYAEFNGYIDVDSYVRAGDGTNSDPAFQFNSSNDGFFHDTSAPGEGIKLMVNNANEALFANGGDFHADGDVISNSSTISDSVFKTDVTTIGSAVDKVKQLRGVSFKWLKGKRSGSADIGVIAQEVEPVLPEIVKTRPLPLWQDKDPEISGSFKTVDYEKLTAVLIESVKEQQTKLEQLEAEIEKLKGG